MPRIVISVSDGQKAVWVEAAHDERVNLSEWVRRAADARAGLGAGETGASAPPAARGDVVSPVKARPAPASSPGYVREFKPDFKGKGKT